VIGRALWFVFLVWLFGVGMAIGFALSTHLA
jgi:hypothetical protein